MEASKQKHSEATLPAATPSYARPTAASAGRQNVLNGSVRSTEIQQQQRKPQAQSRVPPSIRRCEGAASTATSRRMRISARKRTGFFDLPGELRNDIYDLILIDCADRLMTFYDGPCKSDPAHALPPLLRADHRILAEAGSYYFSSGDFDVLLDQQHPEPFLRWFAAIGTRNRARLARNEGVTIRLVHNARWCRDVATHGSSQKLAGWPIAAQRVVGIKLAPAEVSYAQQTFPAVNLWRLTSECNAAAWTWKDPRAARRLCGPVTCEVHPSKLVDVKAGQVRARVRSLSGRVNQSLASQLRDKETKSKMRRLMESVYIALARGQ